MSEKWSTYLQSVRIWNAVYYSVDRSSSEHLQITIHDGTTDAQLMLQTQKQDVFWFTDSLSALSWRWEWIITTHMSERPPISIFLYSRLLCEGAVCVTGSAAAKCQLQQYDVIHRRLMYRVSWPWLSRQLSMCKSIWDVDAIEMTFALWKLTIEDWKSVWKRTNFFWTQTPRER